MEIVIEKLNRTPVSDKSFEIVERKGIGHPDSLTDGICEAASRVLSKYYLEKKGFILHHNLDKGLLIGGVANPVFLGGEIIEPPDIIVAGTASILDSVDDIKKLIYEEVEKYLEDNLRFTKKLNPEVEIKIHPGSTDLVSTYNRYGKGDIPLANDTSFGVGFAPMTKLERLTLSVERFLNSKKLKERVPWVGEDIKVMGIRKNGKIRLTVAIAFVSQFVSSLKDYYDKKEKIKELIKKEFGDDLDVLVNTADHEDSIYLTVSGTSWENGDDGQVGRGNRANGLITPCRTMSLEALAGKNPVSHVGKIYNIKAIEIAEKINQVFDLKEVEVYLVSKIGKPINEPFVGVNYIPHTQKIDENKIKMIVSESLTKESFKELIDKILNDKINVF